MHYLETSWDLYQNFISMFIIFHPYLIYGRKIIQSSSKFFLRQICQFQNPVYMNPEGWLAYR